VDEARPNCKAANLTAICELRQRTWNPRNLTTLWVSRACYRDKFTLLSNRWSGALILTPRSFYPLYSVHRRLIWPWKWSGCCTEENEICAAGNQIQTLQPVARHCADKANRVQAGIFHCFEALPREIDVTARSSTISESKYFCLEESSALLATSMVLAYTSTMKMEATPLPEASLDFQQTIQLYAKRRTSSA
jgi:hypothetical protein